MSQYQNIRIEQHDRVVVVRLDRPKVLNALDEQTMHEVVGALQERDGDPSVGCFVLTGSERSFAAGADIAEMATLDAAAAHARDLWAGWDGLTALRTPLVGAVAGHALGGGCELAMMCDVLLAADTARFGQPEVGLGILPGMGGTQRLARAVGKAKAMEMCLTGRVMDAQEAERAGLVARVVPADRLEAEALELAAAIAAKSKPATMMVKEAVNAAFEMPLQQGVRFERRLFHSAFAQPDQAEGMAAFLEKREPRFSRG